jgi:uncharacterized membrane protein
VRKLIPILLSISALTVSLSVGYYFLIYIPEKDAMLLDLEKQRIKQQEESEQTEKIRRSAKTKTLNVCLSSAEEAGSNYLRLNGTVTKNQDGEDLVQASHDVFEYADKIRETAKEDCYKRYSLE